jgi:hypothetical protein
MSISDPEITFGTFESELFDDKIEGYKFQREDSGSYDIFSDDKEYIFHHGEFNSNYDKQLVMHLQPEQYSELIDKYGDVDNIVMETDYKEGLVAIRYEGSKGSFTHESDNPEKGLIRLIEDYLNK